MRGLRGVGLGGLGIMGRCQNNSWVKTATDLLGNSIIVLFAMDDAENAVAIDQSGQVNNGTWVNGASGAGHDGLNCASLVGANSSRLAFGSAVFNADFNGQEFGVFVWSKVAQSTDGGYLFNIPVNSSNAFAALFKTGASLTYRYVFSGITNQIQLTGTVPDTDWMPLAMTVSKTNDRLRGYKDGSPSWSQITGLGTWAGNLNNSETGFGSRWQGAGHFTGLMQYGIIVNRELTPVEVAILSGEQPDYSCLCGVFRNNATAAITTPTYDGSGQATHPSVIDFGTGNTWNGSRYWMAMTPYPTANYNYENPSILASADGTTWAVPVGATNPLVPMPATGWNSDVELLMSPDNTIMYLFYREHQPLAGATIFAISSTDGVNWSAPTTVLASATPAIVSQTVIYQDGIYKMWYVNHQSIPYRLMYRTSNAPTSGYGAEQACTFTGIPSGFDLWHIQVRYDVATNMYHMFANICSEGLSGANGELYFGWSSDGINWTCSKYPLLPRATGAAFDFKMYRACAVKDGNTYDLFYGGVSAANSWGIGRTTITFTVSGVGLP